MKIHTEQENILKEENNQNNPCVATAICRTSIYSYFPRFFSVIRNPCQFLLIFDIPPDGCVVTN